MSDLILPAGMQLPKEIQQQEKPEEGATNEQKAALLPTPSGYKLLCVVPDVSTTFENSSLIKPELAMRQEEHATTVLFVIDVGQEAYQDKTKFPNGPWAKKGDFVVVRAYAGTRFKVYKKEFRLINDDQVEAVVVDPRGITRA